MNLEGSLHTEPSEINSCSQNTTVSSSSLRTFHRKWKVIRIKTEPSYRIQAKKEDGRDTMTMTQTPAYWKKLKKMQTV